MEKELTILKESLDQKIAVLTKIQAYNEKQEAAFTDGADIASFDEAIEEKGKLIEELAHLDEGFEILYEKIAKDLEYEKQHYAPQIRAIQERIARVTELSTSIQAQEARNKKLVEKFFSREKRGVGESRKSLKAAMHYYKSMSGGAYGSSGAYDNKK